MTNPTKLITYIVFLHRTHVNSISETNENLIINYTTEQVSSGIPKASQPFHIIKIPKTDKALQ